MNGSILGTWVIAGSVTLLFPAYGLGDEPPRTVWGTPDLSGTWNYGSLTPLERPEAFTDRSHFTVEEAEEFVRNFDQYIESEFREIEGDSFVGMETWLEWGFSVEPDLRTSRIIDPPNGRLPELTDAARLRSDATEARRLTYSDPEVLWLSERCVADEVPLLSAPDVNYFKIIQTPDYVVIFKEYDHTTRIIPISDAPRLPGEIRFWSGEARGSWEGDALVVETTQFRPEYSLEGSGPDMRLTERFSLSARDQLRYELTVHDPWAFASDWTVLTYIQRTDSRLYEYACHEGNAMSMTAILRGARLLETQSAAGEN